MNIVFEIINATITFIYLFAFSLFLISIFDVRRYNGVYLSCVYVPRLLKFTAFMDELAEKNTSVSSTHGIYKVLP